MDDFDLTEFAKMFDTALASDNPGVKKALRNFMIVTALVHAEEDGDERIMGPLETLVKKVGDLERMVYELQNNRVTRDYKDYKDYYYNNPTWVYSPNTNTTSTTSTTTSGITEWKDTLDSLGYTAQEMTDLLKDLKFK